MKPIIMIYGMALIQAGKVINDGIVWMSSVPLFHIWVYLFNKIGYIRYLIDDRIFVLSCDDFNFAVAKVDGIFLYLIVSEQVYNLAGFHICIVHIAVEQYGSQKECEQKTYKRYLLSVSLFNQKWFSFIRI